MTSTSRTLVVGAGLSGLACAHTLTRQGRDVVVLEAGARAGGVVDTLAERGFLFETGPTTVPASSRDFRALCVELGLAERWVTSLPRANERYLFHRGKLETLPASPTALLGWSGLSMSARLRLTSEAMRRFDPSIYASEPDLETFLVERLGAEATRLLAGAFVRGVYASELRELGARSAFPRVWNLAVQHGGLIRGLRAAKDEPREPLPGPATESQALLSFPRGLRELPDALARELGPRLRTSTTVTRIERASSAWRVATASGETFDAEHVVLATPAPVIARLLGAIAPPDLPVALLRDVRHADLRLVLQGFAERELPDFPRGFGYLVPPAEEHRSRAEHGPRVLGTLFLSNVFAGRAPAGHASTASFYRASDVAELTDADLALLARAELARALRAPRTPDALVSIVRGWTDVLPKYAPGHADRMNTLLEATRRTLPGLHLAGNCFGGVSVDQVIARGRTVAAEIGTTT
ncbi:MAG: protoporphyrinogen oxidase [Planctomycetota bacterium]